MVDYSWEEIEFIGVKDMNERLAGKVIIVTGAESGIGRSIVQRCIIDGACVTAAGLNVEGLKETADLCAETGGGKNASYGRRRMCEKRLVSMI